MKKQEVKIGGVYSAKITDKVVPVRIESENKHGGWDATNLQTNRKVRIKSAQKLRGQIKVPAAVHDANTATTSEATPSGTSGGRAKKNLTATERKTGIAHIRTQAQADQENARLRDERATNSDGMTASERAMDKTSGAKPTAGKSKRLSLIDAAAQVLSGSKEPMNCQQMVEQVVAKKLWSTDKGKTPHATLYSAILREIQQKGKDARFEKAARGQFTLAKGA